MTDDRWIVIPRWDEFQHRDMARSSVPPWIKNFTRLLHDDDYLNLSQSQRGILHGIWLLFASHRRDLSEARTRLLLVTNKAEAKHWTKNLDAIVHAGFIELSASRPASNLDSTLASLEVEVEREKRFSRTLGAKPEQRIRTMIRNGAISDPVVLQAELRGAGINGQIAQELLTELEQR